MKSIGHVQCRRGVTHEHVRQEKILLTHKLDAQVICYSERHEEKEGHRGEGVRERENKWLEDHRVGIVCHSA